LSHIIDPSHDVLLATRMNGAPLPPDHGYPIRVAMPGTTRHSAFALFLLYYTSLETHFRVFFVFVYHFLLFFISMGSCSFSVSVSVFVLVCNYFLLVTFVFDGY
jgi:hypothetical protein